MTHPLCARAPKIRPPQQPVSQNLRDASTTPGGLEVAPRPLRGFRFDSPENASGSRSNPARKATLQKSSVMLRPVLAIAAVTSWRCLAEVGLSADRDDGTCNGR
jgi:hypothetical protein